MKKFVLAAALSAFATTGFAGAVSDPVVEPEVVTVDTQGSSGGVVLPLILLAVILAAVAD